MYRVKSNAVWYDLPGVEAAYMPIAAPDPVSARLNVGHDHRMVGKYTATPGVPPTWSAARGHTYDGATQYVTTGITGVNQSWTTLVRFSNRANNASIYGCRLPGGAGGYLFLYIATGGLQYGNVTTSAYVAPSLTSGVAGMAGRSMYRNGQAEGALTASGNTITKPVIIGARGDNDAIIEYYNGDVPAFLIASRILGTAEMWLASRQMAYCEVNPDWNAWARRRMYFYAPSAVNAAWAARTNRLIGGGL